MVITRIDIVGDKMFVHERREVHLPILYLPEKVPEGARNWGGEKGYTKLLLTSHGFGYARNRNGLWDKIDIQEEHVDEVDQGSSWIPDLFFQDIAVPQDEWSPRMRKVPVHRKDTDL